MPKINKDFKSDSNLNNDIAIVGISCRLPGANNYKEYWQNIVASKYSVTRVADNTHRKSLMQINTDAYISWMGMLDDIDKFDAEFFHISPHEAELMDPQQRLFLQEAWSCLEDAGYAPKQLSNNKCGVFVGCIHGDYDDLLHSNDIKDDAYTLTGNAVSILSARLSYFLNLTGASMAIDTACSSSLVAIHQACESLHNRTNDMALAGGIYIENTPHNAISLQKANMIAPDGVCKTFSPSADGFIIGEGVGVIVLKRLKDAIRDNDQIYAVIKASGINQDGASHGIIAPNRTAQQNLLFDTYNKFNINPGDIQLFEAHGTGTQQGDVTELDALNHVFKQYSIKNNFCAIGSVKTNIGHTIAAAGIAGLIKLILALKHQQIPPSFYRRPSDKTIDFSDSPFYANNQLKQWEKNSAPRMAAVSSFGFSGTNAHLVLSEHKKDDILNHMISPNQSYIIILSANNDERLIEYAKNLLAYIKQNDNHVLKNIAYTLQVGREAMSTRLALVINDMLELTDGLVAFINKQNNKLNLLTNIDGNVLNQVDRSQSSTNLKIAFDWVNGNSIAWQDQYPKQKPNRISLPTYPFAMTHYWIPNKVIDNKQSISNALNSGLLIAVPKWCEKPLTLITSNTIDEPNLMICYPGHDDNLQQACLKKYPNGRYISLVSDSEIIEHIVQDYFLQLFNIIQKIMSSITQQDMYRIILISENDKYHIIHPLVSMLKTVISEHSQIQYMYIGFSSTDRDNVLYFLETELLKNKKYNISIRYKNNIRQVRQFIPISTDKHDNGSIKIIPDGVYWLTGGLGGIGRILIQYLLQFNNIKIILSGRRELDDNEQSLIKSFNKNCAEVVYIKTDISDYDQVKHTVNNIKNTYKKINGIFHIAGIARDSLLLNKTHEQIKSVLQAKVTGTSAIDFATQYEAIDFLILFSSLASEIGNPGQADYAGANGFLDGFAEYRNNLVAIGQRFGKTQSINWPLWQDGGMHPQVTIKNIISKPINTDEGVQLFISLIKLPYSQVLVAKGNKNAILDYLNTNTKNEEKISSWKTTTIISKAQVLDILRDSIAQLLKIKPGYINNEKYFVDFGFDSITLTQFSNQLKTDYCLTVNPSDFYFYKNIRALADYIWQKINPNDSMPNFKSVESVKSIDAGVEKITKKPLVVNNNISDEPIAIIGMAGRFPQADTIDQLWQYLATGCGAINTVSPDRLKKWQTTSPAQSVNDLQHIKGGFLNSISDFDADFFSIPSFEAQLMDPCQRLLLQEAWHALEDAGITTTKMNNLTCGVFIGAEESQYQTPLLNSGLLGQHSALLSARVAYYLDVHGPCMTINTACSSSLVAIHQACRALQQNDCNIAIAGGISLLTSTHLITELHKLGVLSDTGISHVFNKAANGIIPAEAVGLVALKTLKQAQADGDQIHAVIKASKINYNGRSQGITSPSGQSQQNLLQDLFQSYQIPVDSLDFLIAHGTGTIVGDPIEISALTRAFEQFTQKKEFCALGSVKAMFGHTLAASGIVNLISAVMSIKQQQIPATLMSNNDDLAFELDNTPFYIHSETKPWSTINGKNRLVGISAFGMSGTNAHAIIEEYKPQVKIHSTQDNTRPIIIPISAKSKGAIINYLVNLYDWLSENDHTNIQSLAYTLQTGRAAMNERLVIWVYNISELINTLKIILHTHEYPQNCIQSSLDSLKLANDALFDDIDILLEHWIKQQKIKQIAELWSRGVEINWDLFYQQHKPSIISMPGYAFANDNYWLDDFVGIQEVQGTSTSDNNKISKKKSNKKPEKYML